MHDVMTRTRALDLLAQGLTVSEVSRRTGVSRWAISEWQRRHEQGRPLYSTNATPCPRCQLPDSRPEPAHRYAYLLGLYLGDGCISPVSHPAKRV